MPVTASYSSSTSTLTVTSTTIADMMTVDRDVAGLLRVNGGAIPVTNGPATIANTSLIEMAGDVGDDTIALDETNGALPAADLFGGGGNDTITGGSGAEQLLGGEADNDTLLGKGGADMSVRRHRQRHPGRRRRRRPDVRRRRRRPDGLESGRRYAT